MNLLPFYFYRQIFCRQMDMQLFEIVKYVNQHNSNVALRTYFLKKETYETSPMIINNYWLAINSDFSTNSFLALNEEPSWRIEGSTNSDASIWVCDVYLYKIVFITHIDIQSFSATNMLLNAYKLLSIIQMRALFPAGCLAFHLYIVQLSAYWNGSIQRLNCSPLVKLE